MASPSEPGPSGRTDRGGGTGGPSRAGRPARSSSPQAGTPDLAAAMRARGMRMTAQRRRVIAALGRLGHATADAVAAELATDRLGEVSLSTVYRNLDALQTLGVVAHTHLERGAPTYHLSEHADHVHLVCSGCGRVDEAGVAAAAELAGNLRRDHGFDADVTHLVIHGWCSACSEGRS